MASEPRLSSMCLPGRGGGRGEEGGGERGEGRGEGGGGRGGEGRGERGEGRGERGEGRGERGEGRGERGGEGRGGGISGSLSARATMAIRALAVVSTSAHLVKA